MADIGVDRLRITVSGFSAGSGERLARLIAERLGRAATDISREGRHESMSVDLPAASGTDADQLAAQVVDDLVRQLNRSF
jgi:hypothetical protein